MTAIEAYRSRYIAPLIRHVTAKWPRVVNVSFGRSTIGKEIRCTLMEKIDGSHNRSGRYGKEIRL